ncbi:MAG: UDP-N-acetylglucosamine 1-carboxyvinyltransferase, partial [Arcobacteraceae bacterium]
ITITNVISMHLDAVLCKLEEMGFSIEKDAHTITLLPAKKIKAFKLTTTEYPGFPTDMQAQFMALATQAHGVSIVDENLFENRYMHVNELLRMGADITLKGHTATITGTPNALTGTDVMATDLRASSALVLAGLVANGETNIHRIYHLDRGYEKLEEKLLAIGANVARCDE